MTTATLDRPLPTYDHRPLPAELLELLQPHQAHGTIGQPFWRGSEVVVPVRGPGNRESVYRREGDRWELVIPPLRRGSSKPGAYSISWPCGHTTQEYGHTGHLERDEQAVKDGKPCMRCRCAASRGE